MATTQTAYPPNTDDDALRSLEGDLYARAEALADLTRPMVSDVDPSVVRHTTERTDSRRRRERLGRGYWMVWWSTLVSRTGDGVTVAALPLMAARVTTDVRHVAGVYGAMQLPWIGVPVLAGAMADRLDRRTILVVSNLVRAALLSIVVAASLQGWNSLALLYATAAGLGFAEVFFESANHAVVPALVTAANYERAYGRLAAVDSVCFQLAGPALGALLFTVAVELPFGLDAFSFVVAVVLLRSIRNDFRSEPRTERDPGSFGRELGSGWRWLRRHPTIFTMALLAFWLNVGLQGVYAPMVRFSHEVLGLGDRGFGLVLGGLSAGAIVGGFGAERLARWLGPARAIRVAVMLVVVALVVVGSTSSATVAVAVLALAGVGQVLYLTVSVTIRQGSIPDHLRGRVGSVFAMIAFSGAPVGAALGGITARTWGLHAPFFVGAGICTVALAMSQRRLTSAGLTSIRTVIDLTDGAMGTGGGDSASAVPTL